MNERTRAILRTGSLALISVAVFYAAGQGAFVQRDRFPLVFAAVFTPVVLWDVVSKPRAALAPRLLLGLLTMGLVWGAVAAHASFTEMRRRGPEDAARAELLNRPAPPLRFGHERNLPPEARALVESRSGRLILVEFWATWCGPCRESMPKLERLQRRFGDRLLVVGVTRFYSGAAERRQELEEITSFLEERGVHYPILIEDTEGTHRAYRVALLPTTVIIQPNGEVTHYWIGDYGADAAIAEVEQRLLLSP